MTARFRRILDFAALSFVVCIWASSALAERATVLLRNGGIVTGDVVLYVPGERVILDLGPSGQASFAAEEIREVRIDAASTPTADLPTATPGPAPPPAATSTAGQLHIEASAPARVRIDGGDAGRAPISVEGVSPGRHLVRVDFDEGGSEQKQVYVQSGQRTALMVQAPAYTQAGRYRRGLHFLLGGGPFFHAMTGGTTGRGAFGGGAQINAGLNFGLTSGRADLRLLGLVNAGTFGTYYGGGTMAGFELGVRPSVRLNFGSKYAMELGLRMALFYDRHDYMPRIFEKRIETRTAFEVGPEISVLSFRFGDLRQFEVTLWHAAIFNTAGYMQIQNGLGFTYLFL